MIAPQPAVEPVPLGALILTCGAPDCRHTFEPDPVAMAGARLCCPRCGGWTFQAELVEPGEPVPSVLTPPAGAARGGIEDNRRRPAVGGEVR